ncbi:hypothetical protein [Halobacteriovorax marinus]|nr:hypothetical protein [Halobacteriovorax marinus]
MKILITFFIVFSTYSMECVSHSLKEIGFSFATKKEFSVIESDLDKWIKENQDDFILDYQSRMFSSVHKKFVSVLSLDNIQTSEEEMFGDLILIRDLASGDLLEARWYKYGLKIIAFDRKKANCPVAVVPIAVNTLF